MPELNGGCLCGGIRFRVTAEPFYSDHCHCTLCRRSSGAPLATAMTVPREAVAWTGEAPRVFKSSAWAKRGFCGRCGSKVTFDHADFPDDIDFPLGSLDDPGLVVPIEQLHGESRLGWLRVDPDIPWREGHAPSDDGPRTSPATDPARRREGGCLCGAIRYALTGAPIATAICHSPSYRRATGGLFAAWGVWLSDRVTALAGEPGVYEDPTAGRHRFCRTCGTSISFENPGAGGLMMITLTGLDDPNAVSPALHQFAAHAPAWLVCDDALPRYPAAAIDGGSDDALLR